MIYGTMIGALTLALAASSVDARKRSFDDLAAGLDDTDSGKTTTTTSSSGSRRATARIVCSSEAWASTYSGFMDSYISAVADVIADVCDPYWLGSPVKATEAVYGWASAYASAAASATAACTSTVSGGGRARGCAYSEADSYAAATAYASVHASASAEAFAEYCTCANAEAWSFGDADLFVELWVSAYASAEAAACAEDNEASEASAYVNCYADIIAETFAFAAAKASADAGCYYGYTDVHARTEVEALVDAYVNNYESCTVTTDESGRAEGDGRGGTTSGSRFD